jgi:hypothetical protein
MARPERFELPTLWFEARCSDPLSYGRVWDIIASSLFTGTSVCVSVGSVDVFGAEAEAYHAGGDAAEDREVF